MSFTRYALIDCNSFFVSCERLFNPQLLKRPVVVLSNNDGCIIARSDEAKALQIPMGAPAFQFKQQFLKHRVAVLSSNFSLYGDISRRVMDTLDSFGYPIEVYSIDEAFLKLPLSAGLEIADRIRSRVMRWIGIPISIGIGATKTLAKLGSDLAKNTPSGVSVIESPFSLLDSIPIEEIWGIGYRLGKALRGYGIQTAGQLVRRDPTWIQQKFSVALLKTALELQGISTLDLDNTPAPKKSIVTSRSFGRLVTSLEELKEAVATFISMAGAKLRRQKTEASQLTVFLYDQKKNGVSISTNLPTPTAYTPDLIHHAHHLVSLLYKEGNSYRKAGVMLQGIFSDKETQLDLFAKPRNRKLMQLMDQINQMYGERSLFFAAQGTDHHWSSLKQNLSSRFTTRWDELLTIQL